MPAAFCDVAYRVEPESRCPESTSVPCPRPSPSCMYPFCCCGPSVLYVHSILTPGRNPLPDIGETFKILYDIDAAEEDDRFVTSVIREAAQGRDCSER